MNFYRLNLPPCEFFSCFSHALPSYLGRPAEPDCIIILCAEGGLTESLSERQMWAMIHSYLSKFHRRRTLFSRKNAAWWFKRRESFASDRTNFDLFGSLSNSLSIWRWLMRICWKRKRGKSLNESFVSGRFTEREKWTEAWNRRWGRGLWSSRENCRPRSKRSKWLEN